MKTLSLFCSLILVFGEGVAQWELRHPENQLAQVSSVFFTNPQQGYFTTLSGFIFATSDSGKTWSRRLHVSRDKFFQVAFADSEYGLAYSFYSYLNDTEYVFVTTDGGKQWAPRSSALAHSVPYGTIHVQLLPLSRTVWLFTGDDGIIIRTNNAFSTTNAVWYNKIFFRTDYGEAYGRITEFCKLPNGAVYALGNSSTAYQASRIKDSVSYLLKSIDNGSHWDTLWCGTKYALTSIAVADSAIGWMAGERSIIYKTTDSGLHWTLQHKDTLLGSAITKIVAFDSSTVYGIAESGDFFASINGGATWNTRATLLPGWPSGIDFCNSSLGYGYGVEGLFRTTDGGFHWTKMTGNRSGYARRSAFASDQIGFTLLSGQLFQTNDGGYHWSAVPALINKTNLQDVAAVDSLTIWIVASDSILHTTDGGKAWQSTPLETNTSIRGIKFYGSNVGVQYEVRKSGDTAVSHYVTTDGGTTWKEYQLPEKLSSYDKLIFTDESHAWFFTQQGIFLSRDTSKTWKKITTPLGLSGGFDSPFDFVDSLFGCIANFNDVCVTTDGGSTWASNELPFTVQLTDVAFTDRQHGYVSGWEGTVFSTSDGGRTWKSDETMSAETINQLSVLKNKNVASIYAVGDNLTVIHQTIVLSAMQPASPASPSTFYLSQNYPNPFNPNTTIRYSLPFPNRVKLAIYNVLGQVVSELVNEAQSSGWKEIHWNAKIASGIYFYRIEAVSLSDPNDRFVQVKKMVVLK